MKIHCLYDQMMPLHELEPHPKNRNKHPKDQIERLAKILQYQGFRYPIKISSLSGKITSGHGRLEAAKLLGMAQVPVVMQDYDDEVQEYADVQADNAIAAWAELDLSGINVDIGELGPFDLDMLGLKDFRVDVAEKDAIEDDVPQVPKEAKSKLGDLYKLGEHRLLCGDSTDILQVERLMGGEKADLWLTDPPYGVGMQAREESSSSSWVNKDRVNSQISNDDRPITEMKQFWTNCAATAYVSTSDKASYIWFACQGGDQMMMMMMMMALGDAEWQVKHELIWVKDQMVFGRADYHYKHEPILFGWKRKGTHEFFGDRTQTSVIECPRPKKSDLHPTMKPIELIERLLGNHSQAGSKVLDLFGGSGSTLIACEKTNRKCFMMELDPLYCDVIVERWEKYTGQKAELTNG
jgi:DNA modification methylase